MFELLFLLNRESDNFENSLVLREFSLTAVEFEVSKLKNPVEQLMKFLKQCQTLRVVDLSWNNFKLQSNYNMVCRALWSPDFMSTLQSVNLSHVGLFKSEKEGPKVYSKQDLEEALQEIKGKEGELSNFDLMLNYLVRTR